MLHAIDYDVLLNWVVVLGCWLYIALSSINYNAGD